MSLETRMLTAVDAPPPPPSTYVPARLTNSAIGGGNDTVTYNYPQHPPTTTQQSQPSTMIQQQSLLQQTKLPSQQQPQQQQLSVVPPPDIYNSVKDLRLLRIPMYVLTLVDLFATVLLVIVTIRWTTAPDLNIPLLYLFLLLLQIPHLFTSPAMLAVIFDSRNFYFINMVAVIVGIAWAANAIGLVWRSVCLAYEGSLTCPIVAPGRWLAWTVWGLVFILFVTSIALFVVLVLYIRGLKRNLVMEFDVLSRQRDQQQTLGALQSTTSTTEYDPRHTISFRQSPELYFARSRIRALAGIDMFIYALATLLRIAFLYGVGFWYAPYLQATHLFLWLWQLDIGGSLDFKTPISLGGTDASQSELFVQVTFYTFVFAIVADSAALLLCAWDVVVVTLSVFTLLEVIFGHIILLLYLGLVLYDIYSLYSLSSLLDSVARLAINKQHYQ